jgi:hypothetical protein
MVAHSLPLTKASIVRFDQALRVAAADIAQYREQSDHNAVVYQRGPDALLSQVVGSRELFPGHVSLPSPG